MKVVHFGVGALGRGLTIPMLVKSGCQVTVVDAYEPLVNKLKETGYYLLYSVNAPEDQQHQTIRFEKALSLNTDLEQVINEIKETDVVTTSVIRENVINVVRLLAEAWSEQDTEKKMVLLCENIENGHDFFQGLLREVVTDEKQLEKLLKIRVPDIMVDRGCAKNPNNILEVITDEFIEICVDKKIVEDTGIKYIPAVDNIDGAFARKRYLVNTKIDAMSFLGVKHHLNGITEVFTNETIHRELDDYMNLVRKALTVGFGMTEEDVIYWENTYNERFLNTLKKMGNASSNARSFDSVVRNMMRKISYNERFVYPLIVLLQHGYDVSKGINLIADIAKYEMDKYNMDKNELFTTLHDMWCIDEYGQYIYDEVTRVLQ